MSVVILLEKRGEKANATCNEELHYKIMWSTGVANKDVDTNIALTSGLFKSIDTTSPQDLKIHKTLNHPRTLNNICKSY